jgi:hypothetical protein
MCTPQSPFTVLALLALLGAGPGGCGADDAGAAAAVPTVTVGEPEQVVPFAAAPVGVTTQPANNNLDVVEHDGRVFLAFRTAPSHFASAKTELYVVSSVDQRTWQLEARLALGTDLREPRFLSYAGELRLYFAVLGSDPAKFEPQGTKLVTYEGAGVWSEPVDWVDQPGFIPWRMKVIDGRAYMIGYVGGENIYEIDGEPIFVEWLTSDDGLAWRPVAGDDPVVEEGGGSETDFVLQDDGSVVAVTRNEAGDATGWGSKICRAEAGALGEWQCAHDPRKYDSPLVFRHGQGVYLIGRRNLTETGNYDLGCRDLSAYDQTFKYLTDYSFAPKRCSLWSVDPEALTVSFLLDLPSKGDTCFASILPSGPSSYTVYNYTSPVDGEDRDWIQAQGLPTLIYRAELTFP